MEEAIKRIQKAEKMLWSICGAIFVFAIIQSTHLLELKNSIDQIKVLKWLTTQSFDFTLDTNESDKFYVSNSGFQNINNKLKIHLPNRIPKRIKQIPKDTTLSGFKSYFAANPQGEQFLPDTSSFKKYLKKEINSAPWYTEEDSIKIDTITSHLIDTTKGYKINSEIKYFFETGDFHSYNSSFILPGKFFLIKDSSASAVELTKTLLSKSSGSLKNSPSLFATGGTPKIFPELSTSPYWSNIKKKNLDESLVWLEEKYQDKMEIDLFGYAIRGAKSILLISPSSVFIILFFILANLIHVEKNLKEKKEKIDKILDKLSWPLKLKGFTWLSFVVFPLISLALLFYFNYYFEHSDYSYWIGLFLGLITIGIGVVAVRKTRLLINT